MRNSEAETLEIFTQSPAAKKERTYQLFMVNNFDNSEFIVMNFEVSQWQMMSQECDKKAHRSLVRDVQRDFAADD